MTELQIERYLQGHLGVEDMEIVEAHISLCPECLARFEEESDLHRSMAPAARLVAEEDSGTETAGHARRAAPWWETMLGALRRHWSYAAAAPLVAVGLLALAPSLRESRAPQSISLQALRSAPGAAVAEPDRQLILRADLVGMELPQGALLLLVDASGATIATERISAGERQAVWRISSGLPLGAYWVRVVPANDRRSILREYALEIR